MGNSRGPEAATKGLSVQTNPRTVSMGRVPGLRQQSQDDERTVRAGLLPVKGGGCRCWVTHRLQGSSGHPEPMPDSEGPPAISTPKAPWFITALP